MIYKNKFLFPIYVCLFKCSVVLTLPYNGFHEDRFWDPFERKYGWFPESLRLESLEETRKMFYFAYDNYMKYAFPKDELDPIHCTGRGPDYANP